MPNGCSISGCKSRYGERIKFHLIPLKRRDIWIRIIRATRPNFPIWTMKEHSAVCSKHFVDGRPTPKNPDPTLNMNNYRDSATTSSSDQIQQVQRMGAAVNDRIVLDNIGDLATIDQNQDGTTSHSSSHYRWDDLPQSHILVDEKRLLTLFQNYCQRNDCHRSIDSKTVRIKNEENTIRIIYKCTNGHKGEWTSRRHPTKSSDNRLPYSDQHFICVQSTIGAPKSNNVCSDLIGLRADAFQCLLKAISFYDRQKLFNNFTTFLQHRFRNVDIQSSFPQLSVSCGLLMTLIDLRLKISSDLLIHLIFGHFKSDRKLVKTICGYWTIFLSDWSLDLRRNWLSIRTNKTGLVECFEISLSSEFRRDIQNDARMLADYGWQISDLGDEPRLKFAVIYLENENTNQMADAILDWSSITVTFKSDQDFMTSIAQKRGWLIMENKKEERCYLRKNRLRRFLRLFEECSDWEQVMERNLKLNVCCALANLIPVDEIDQIEF